MLNFGIIFELLHSMALIHDDIIDQAGKRHNALTVHSYIHTLLAANPTTSNMADNAEHIAE
ncbi:MAG: polyprenyl synthetase family protein [bacterium]